MRYDPNRAVDPKAWLALDEQVRIDLALEYHTRARVELPNAKLHAVVHEPGGAWWRVPCRGKASAIDGGGAEPP